MQVDSFSFLTVNAHFLLFIICSYSITQTCYLQEKSPAGPLRCQTAAMLCNNTCDSICSFPRNHVHASLSAVTRWRCVSCLVHVQIQLQLLKSLLYFSNSRPVKGLNTSCGSHVAVPSCWLEICSSSVSISIRMSRCEALPSPGNPAVSTPLQLFFCSAWQTASISLQL